MRYTGLFCFILLNFLDSCYFATVKRNLNREFERPTCAEGRSVTVHLFNWLWADIEKECRTFLGPKGFCAVQISPPNEHKIVINRPWWERYQPVSYILGSRSGSPEEFASMVKACNEANVRIFADVVINHMARAVGDKASGSWGSCYDTENLYFAGVPYSANDFHCCTCGSCSTHDCNIHNYNDFIQVRNCRLEALADLNMGSNYVREKILDYLNHLIDLGVAGFRVDAAKHMWPGDMKEIFIQLNNLNTTWFPSGTSPYIYNEVIELGGEPISGSEYYNLGLGQVTEFRYGRHLSLAFRKHFPLHHLKSFGNTWGMHPSQYALVFLDNHDNQRGHGGGGESIITFYEHRLYKMATAFALAWPYGSVRIMSSYRFGYDQHSTDRDLGPPTTDGHSIKAVVIKADGSCDDGTAHSWVCEHRWRQITNMVQWRNVAGDTQWNIVDWWDNGGDQIAFSRDDKAFIAINNDNIDMLSVIKTPVSPGIYCDIISGSMKEDGNGCTGKLVQVDADNNAFVYIEASSEDHVIAIHSLSRVLELQSWLKSANRESSMSTQRTVVCMPGNSDNPSLFIRGGISHSVRKGCDNKELSQNPCGIKINHNVLQPNSSFTQYNTWSQGDEYLDWYGQEKHQKSYHHSPAQGTPLAWISNDQNMDGCHPLNRYGTGYWMADFYMDCDETIDGWFEVKVFTTDPNSSGHWEDDINPEDCSGPAGGKPPYSVGNHLAKCGHVNVFQYGSPFCYVTYHNT